MVPITVQRLLSLAGRGNPSKIAISVGRRSLTYGELHDRAQALAQGFATQGLRVQDRVGLLLPNDERYVLSGLACAFGRFCMVPINHRFVGSEIRQQLVDSGARLLLYDKYFEGAVEAVGRIDGLRTVEASRSEMEKWTNCPPPQPILPNGEATENDTFYLGYTSGTTGKPKGAIISQRNRAMAYLYWALEFGITKDDIGIQSSPFHHTAPFTFSLCQLSRGGAIVILDGFNAVNAISEIQKHEVTWGFFVPFMIERLLEEDFRAETCPTLRMIVSGAAVLPQRARDELLRRFPRLQLYEFYGATEAGVITKQELNKNVEARCVGVPIADTEIAIRDDEGRFLTEPSAVGNIWIKGVTLFNGYHNAPSKTAEVQDGAWCTVGDIGYLDEGGRLFLLDRKKDMIKSGGVNIYPIEIEEVLRQSSHVKACAVVGLSDDTWGEVTTAFIVPTEDSDKQYLSRELTALCRGQLADYKCPKSYRWVSELPRNANGKVLKRELRNIV